MISLGLISVETTRDDFTLMSIKVFFIFIGNEKSPTLVATSIELFNLLYKIA
jgi:hypothetical protein